MGEFDFREIIKFRDNLKEMQRAWPDFMEECAIELANRLLAKVVPRTPTDSGELRRSWAINHVTFTSGGAEVEVINYAYYYPYVEYGHRTADHKGWVDGRFMMTISEQELERELPAIMERKLQRFIERYLGR
ncbi:HK97 gp10 family phage protein [Paenibacillus sp. VCA1]|uniref:HK97 gp10 family phage protein n=1 Tax=Paenibacillus sp. VCA1 TaxID=3039148 RepID=UPI0028719E7E|nr:HK97 gp10 family phage protein [Paenibacillus sp. VCA1]MDR9857809.1 HK97 gp10 family phage protein [Paenibacillus sp. VCA1]